MKPLDRSSNINITMYPYTFIIGYRYRMFKNEIIISNKQFPTTSTVVRILFCQLTIINHEQ